MAEPEHELRSLPGADLIGDGWFAVVSDEPQLELTQSLAFLFEVSREGGYQSVLITRPDATLSPALGHALSAELAGWGVRDPDGELIDARSGVRIVRMEDLFGGGSLVARATTYATVPPRSVAVHIDCYLRHRPDPATILGGAATLIFRALGAGDPVAWDVAEPVLRDWDPRAFTLDARRHMPKTPRYVVRSAEGGWLLEVIRHTEVGIEEHLSGGFVVGPWSERDVAVARAHETLRVICGNAQVERATATIVETEPDGGWAPRRHQAPDLVGLALGARLQRLMGLSSGEVAATPGVELFGRAKLATALWAAADDEDLAHIVRQLAGVEDS